MRRVRAAIAGANGYAGMTLVNLLERHPGVELAQLTSRSHAGQPYSAVFPLLGREGTFLDAPRPDEVEVVFGCLPHGVAASRVPEWLAAGVRVIDLSADFRLRDPSAYPRWYHQEHPAPQLLADAVLGLPELHAPEIADARLIAVPGCYSTASILALAPAVAGDLVASDVIVDAKSGVSGSGRSPGLGTHFSEVSESVHAYAIGGHRHLPELVQELGRLNGGGAPGITFVPHLIPMIRGILSTCYFDARGTPGQLRDAYREFYAGQPFVRVLADAPATKLASHTNLCLIGLAAQGEKVVVAAALDNLVKGAAGQAVQALNVRCGWDERAGLEFTGLYPL